LSTVQFTARSEEDAVRKAADNLSIPASEVSYKIVSRTSGGLLGMLGQQVVTIEVTLQEKVAEAPAPVEAPAKAPAGAPESAGEAAEKPRQERRERKPRKPRPERKAAESEDEGPVEIDDAIFAKKLAQANVLMADIVEIVGSTAEVKAYQKGSEIIVSVVGELPSWFGRGASRTVEALQFVLNKIVNRFPPRYRVIVVTEGKREERLEHLHDAASQLGQKLLEAGETAWVVPMNPKERRIVHLAVAPMEGIETHSLGDGNSRRIRLSTLASKTE
jgi:spoIIIJ-associated protein